MIDVLFEQHVIQNTGLAAEAIWYAVNEAYSAQGRTAGVGNARGSVESNDSRVTHSTTPFSPSQLPS
jgi:hypothetical protein